MIILAPSYHQKALKAHCSWWWRWRWRWDGGEDGAWWSHQPPAVPGLPTKWWQMPWLYLLINTNTNEIQVKIQIQIKYKWNYKYIKLEVLGQLVLGVRGSRGSSWQSSRLRSRDGIECDDLQGSYFPIHTKFPYPQATPSSPKVRNPHHQEISRSSRDSSLGGIPSSLKWTLYTVRIQYSTHQMWCLCVTDMTSLPACITNSFGGLLPLWSMWHLQRFPSFGFSAVDFCCWR